ncbi:hypothetical protein [Phenylobacterium sp.]|uniref:hypothetical protein n=1 Tax=Phenylobacterium sp. TaxID=1871053 RepID=UPI002FCAF9D5
MTASPLLHTPYTRAESTHMLRARLGGVLDLLCAAVGYDRLQAVLSSEMRSLAAREREAGRAPRGWIG